MKVSREQAAQNRERILEVGTRLFRERGFDGIGVADLMREAGLTHGGFYGHFASKEDLMAKACERALARSSARWESLFARDGRKALAALADSYLSTRHRDHPGAGCIAPTVAIEASRQGPVVRRAFSDGLRSLIDVLARCVPGRTKTARRKRALASFAGMVGAIVLARAVDDEALSADILAAVRDEIAAMEG